MILTTTYTIIVDIIALTDAIPVFTNKPIQTPTTKAGIVQGLNLFFWTASERTEIL